MYLIFTAASPVTSDKGASGHVLPQPASVTFGLVEASVDLSAAEMGEAPVFVPLVPESDRLLGQGDVGALHAIALRLGSPSVPIREKNFSSCTSPGLGHASLLWLSPSWTSACASATAAGPGLITGQARRLAM